MTTAGLQDHKKLAVALISLLIFVLLRWQALAGTIWANAGMVELNQYPAWHSIPLNVETPEAARVRQAVLLNPDSKTLWTGWGIIHFVQGKADEALAIWQSAGLDSVQVATFQGWYSSINEQDDVALTWFEYAVELDPKQAEAWYEIGRLRQRAGLNEAAKAAYAQAWTLGYADSADPLAKIWRDDGAHETAIEIWLAALDTFPEHPHRLRWWQGLTNSLRATKQWEAGVNMAEVALKEFPEDARLYVEYGAMVYSNSGDFNVAINALNRAVKLDDTITAAYSTAAGIMASESQYMAAYEWYSEAAERDPRNPSWYVAQGNMARAAGELSLALSAFETAVTRFPNFAPAHYGIALVFQQLEEKENAANAITRALQLMERRDVQYYLRAGEIYEWQGNLVEATAAYRQALEIDPNNETAATALQRLLGQ